jgi:RNA polymerase sigma factor (sigma-70 family)
MNRQFPNTRWTLVMAAGGATSPHSRAALEELCRLYWAPVYGFFRHRGKSADEAADLTQGLFADLLARKDFAVADPDRGKFRSWLLGCAKNFLANEFDRASAAKRAPPLFEISTEDAERRFAAEPADQDTPETRFLRRWIWSALEHSLRALRDETAEASLKRFDVLSPYLIDAGEQSYAEAGKTLELSENATKQAVHKLRERFRGHLRALLADTLGGDGDIDAELRELMGSLSSGR